jgi:ribA/ribD-fused uncharacterized protein
LPRREHIRQDVGSRQEAASLSWGSIFIMITAFFGPYRFLSNFCPAPIVFDGRQYAQVESAYQSAKSLDPEIREGFTHINTPSAAKRLGRLIELRPDWDGVRVTIMTELIRLKFDVWGPPINDCTHLCQPLVNTFPHELIEGNTWGDTFWGVCDGIGENWLGRILMRRRMELLSLGMCPDFREPTPRPTMT